MQPTTSTEFAAPPMARPDPTRYAEDNRLHVEFHRVPVLHEHKSKEAGRAIYIERDFVRIHIPGDRLNIIDRPVDSMDEQRFADRLAKWRAGQAEAVAGTPLTAMPSMTPGKVKEYEYFAIKTVEQLAAAADNLGQKFMSFHQDKAAAKAFIEVAKGNAPMEALNAALQERDAVIDDLKTRLDAMQAQMKMPSKRALAAAEAVS